MARAEDVGRGVLGGLVEDLWEPRDGAGSAWRGASAGDTAAASLTAAILAKSAPSIETASPRIRRGGLEAPAVALALRQLGFVLGALLADDPDDATAASGRAESRGERELGVDSALIAMVVEVRARLTPCAA